MKMLEINEECFFACSDRNSNFGRAMEQIAKSYAACHREYLAYCLDDDGEHMDIGWFYNERTNIGFLAAAAWRSGFVALEEYVCDKTHAIEADRDSLGRADLYIGAQFPDYEFVELVIEAKIAFVYNSESIRKELDCNIDNSVASRALREAARNKLDTGQHGCAAIFVCPELKKGTDSTGDIFDKISDDFFLFAQRLTATWAAFSFVPALLKHEHSNSDVAYSYPGIGVIIARI